MQADGSSVIHQLIVSICSTTSTGLMKCLVPSKFSCRKLSRNTLKFGLSCDQHCVSKDSRFKVVVATNLSVLCYSRDMFVLDKISKIVALKEQLKKILGKKGQTIQELQTEEQPALRRPRTDEIISQMKSSEELTDLKKKFYLGVESESMESNASIADHTVALQNQAERISGENIILDEWVWD